MEAQEAVHNRVAPAVVSEIVKSVAQSGGGPVDAIIITESVVLGVVLALYRVGGLTDPSAALDSMVEGIRTRMAEKLPEMQKRMAEAVAHE